MRLFLFIIFNFILFNLSGQFSSQHIIYEGSGLEIPANWSLGDITGDGIKDVVASDFNGAGGDLIWSLGLGNGVYDQQNNALFESTLESVLGTHIADINSDGTNDIIVLNRVDDTWADVFIIYSNGNGNFQNPLLIGNVANPVDIRNGDLSGNDLMDIVISRQYAEPLAIYQLTPNVFTGQDFSVVAGAYGDFLELRDVDNDGDLDIMFGGQEFEILLNDGNGEFTETIDLDGGLGSNSLGVIEDFDNDGDYDVVFETSFSGLNYFKNENGEMIEVPDAFPSDDNTTYRDIIVGDFNEDGIKDIAVGCWFTDCKATIYFSDGADNFSPFTLCSGSNLVDNCLIADDFNGDGLTDLGFANGSAHDLLYFKNDLSFCSDESACNYSEDYTGPDVNCCYDSCGCTDEDSDDYDPAAICDDGSCRFSINLFSFYDDNSNGLYNGGADYFIPNSSFLIQPGDYIANSGNSNSVTMLLPRGQYTATAIPSQGFDYITGDDNITFSVNCDGPSSSTNFGWNYLNAEEDGDVAFFPSSNIGMCDQVVSGHVCASNSGNQSQEFTLELLFDELIIDPLFPSNASISQTGDSYIVELGELDPGEVICLEIQWQNTGVNNIGEFLNIDLDLNAVNANDDLILVAENTFETELVCAYDPNDKLVWPEGEFEGNFVEIGTDLEYMIRFQNTGSAAASQVILIDTISPTLDLSTIEISGNSHLFDFQIDNQTRVLTFEFNNINLPHAEQDEPGSHGFVSFKISHHSDLNETIEVNNTAYIYFDNNPPIVTNTTLTTLYECNDFFASFSSSDENYCQSVDLELTANVSTGNSYNWNINGNDVSTENMVDLSGLGLGNHTVTLEVSSQICDANLTQNITIQDCATGIEQVVSEETFQLFPNPTDHEITAQLSSSRKISAVILRSMDGKVIKQYQDSPASTWVLDVSDVSKGIYLVQIIIDNDASLTLYKKALIK